MACSFKMLILVNVLMGNHAIADFEADCQASGFSLFLNLLIKVSAHQQTESIGRGRLS